MSDVEDVKAVLVNYYESLSNGVVKGITRNFDETVTAISLAGSTAVTGTVNLENAFNSFLENWLKLGVNCKFQYDPSQFRIEDVQDNVKIVRTRLTNFKENGEIFETWNCMYVLCKKDDGWKISLVTFDDKASAQIAEG
jgi:hypothetical protein